jgi:hypothetical protein
MLKEKTIAALKRADEAGAHLNVSIIHAGDNSCTWKEDAINDYATPGLKLCCAHWEYNGHICAFVTYPAHQRTPTEAQLRAEFRQVLIEHMEVGTWSQY